jgi:rhamnogalacturonyl hydrolase YesR
MAMPVFAKLAKITGDQKYSERMYRMYVDTKITQGLYNKQDKLWWRDKDFLPPYKEPNGEDCYWSRGNGWVVAALVRVMEILPNDTHFKDYRKTYLEMMKALLPLQREDGFWNASLHDPNNFGGKETSGTALFVYGMAWGVNNGLLSAKKYMPAIVKGWNAMAGEAVHPDGFLGYVQGTGKQPSDSQPVSYTAKPDFEDYGLGCFLLAGSEVYKLK